MYSSVINRWRNEFLKQAHIAFVVADSFLPKELMGNFHRSASAQQVADNPGKVSLLVASIYQQGLSR